MQENITTIAKHRIEKPDLSQVGELQMDEIKYFLNIRGESSDLLQTLRSEYAGSNEIYEAGTAETPRAYVDPEFVKIYPEVSNLHSSVQSRRAIKHTSSSYTIASNFLPARVELGWILIVYSIDEHHGGKLRTSDTHFAFVHDWIKATFCAMECAMLSQARQQTLQYLFRFSNASRTLCDRGAPIERHG